LHCRNDILISIRPEYVAGMLGGNKSVEVRRRAIRVPVGTTVWIYETVPSGRIGVSAEISALDEGVPDEIWRRYHDRLGISRKAFLSYVNGSEQACVVVLGRITPLRRSLRLTELRTALGAFTVPQFYRRLAQDGPELSLLRGCSGVLAANQDCGSAVKKAV
jgi:predicted transcriptional regulator